MKRTSDGYYKNRHSCFLLQYQLVLVTRRRCEIIKGRLEEELIQYTKDYFAREDLPVIEINTMPDQIQILFEASPVTDLAAYINAYKSASSRHVRKLFPEELKACCGEPSFWSLSYFIGSAGENNLSAVVQKYIQNQKDG